ncbi:putative DNA helicase [Legionella pneumophila]|uniref:AAA domain-containing protein n=1 Tax=Legionella pneumophila TaxID=446 RepID=UPI0005C8E8A3|nr:AAA domain-containing protein [Legionella pneumophila]HAT8828784.1 AAA family ATPase [Legionella pneumophila subsp. pneumophila]WAI80196.1 AAA domain-containing protein [Legionella pneumophila]CZG43804.1 putative DNA helicase [Legionella pneumophila]CZH71947.1 putative DNA helicase [Legionella pneumophila]HAT4693867.1 AAA family ATPase [Legionella pneumophila]
MLSEIKHNLIQLLDFAKSIYAIRDKSLNDFSKDPIKYFILGKTLASYDNVSINTSFLDAPWISIQRVEKTSPPVPPEICQPFLKGQVIDNHKIVPSLNEIASLRKTNEEANALVESGIAKTVDIRPVKKLNTEDEDYVDALIKSINFPEMCNEFTFWINESWKPWAVLEKENEARIDLYRLFFKISQELRRHGEDFELILGQNLVIASSEESNDKIIAPLIEHILEISIDENKGYSILFTPKDTIPRVVSDPYKTANLPGATQIRSELSNLILNRENEAKNSILPFDMEFVERVAILTSGFLHPDAIADLEIEDIPEPKSYPVATKIWFVALRPKSQQSYVTNVEELRQQISNAESEDEIPKAGISFASPPSEELIDLGIGGFDVNSLSLGGVSSWSSAPTKESTSKCGHDGLETFEKFFPLPFNDEQSSILRLIENNHAVSVQGPPGTGKSHTIANIIAHYIATGRRVLVSAKTPEALVGVREKLPESLSKLAISILDTDVEGKEQLENAIRYISSEAQGLEIGITQDEISRLQTQIIEHRKRIANIDTALLEHAHRQLNTIKYKGEESLPYKIVNLLKNDKDEYSWFPDELGLGSEYDIKFDDSILNEIRSLRLSLQNFVIYSSGNIPNIELLPDIPTLKNLHENLQRSRNISELLTSGDLPEPADNIPDFHQKMQLLKDVFDTFSAYISHDNGSEYTKKLLKLLINTQEENADKKELINLLTSAIEWVEKTEKLLVYSINYDEFDWNNIDLQSAILRSANGNTPFNLLSVLKSNAKNEYKKIRIRGLTVQTQDDWKNIYDMVCTLAEANTIITRWNSLSSYFGLFKLPSDFMSSFNLLKENRPLLTLVDFKTEDWNLILSNIKEVFPYGLNHIEISEFGCEFDRAYSSILNWSVQCELSESIRLCEQLTQIATISNGPVFDRLEILIKKLGTDENIDLISDEYREIRQELSLLAQKQYELAKLNELVKPIQDNGACKWADLLSHHPIVGYDDNICPNNWREAWEYSRVRGFINSLASRNKIDEFIVERIELEKIIQKNFNRIIELRAILGLRKNMTQKISSALARFSAAFTKIGKNVRGIRSISHQKEARAAMKDCYDSIPCWIIPESRVEEQIPAKLKAFDLVIIDEASQSDVTAIPIILRGEKLLVVGDDKQVSPNPVGLKENRIEQIIEESLCDHPLKKSFHPTNSLYDLVGIMSPGKRVTLREHFRCVEPIINFCSKNFYSEPLIPLRIPKSCERLDPPLIDIFVKNGIKDKDINIREAEVIVDEIEKMVSDPYFQNRTIGVISLLGFKQSGLIDKLILDRIGVELYENHKIICGDARYFQGQERDIIFLSMVASPSDARAQTTRNDRQKYNVAVSRARDRLILVRSVHENHLTNPEDLKLLLLDHFKRPVEITSFSKNQIELCDSEFEREVFRKLTADGYRTIPQYKVGLYSIDFVIEGLNDRRLAVELDGDRYHGPDQFAHDQYRQRSLERVGWSFWRCWASDWNSDPDTCYADLVRELSQKGIEPIGADYIPSEYVRYETRGEEEDTFDIIYELENLVEA